MYAHVCGLNGGIIELESAVAISLYRAAALRVKAGYFRGDISLSLGVGRPVPYPSPQPSSLETEEQNGVRGDEVCASERGPGPEE